MAVGECYAPGSLAQLRGDDTKEIANEGENAGTEVIAGLPACTGAATETVGVDCKKARPLPICKRNVLPTTKKGETINCRV